MSTPWTETWRELGGELVDGRPQRFAVPQSEIDALRGGTAMHDRGRGDLLRVRGEDRVDLLHRIAATDFESMSPGLVRPAVFTSEKGRVLDLSLAAAEGDRMFLLCGNGRAHAVREWIDRFTITEDVTTHHEAQAGALTIVGDGAAQTISVALGVTELPQDGFLATDDFAIFSDPIWPRPVFHVVLLQETHARPMLEALLSQLVIPAGELAFAQWSHESGVARPGLELSEDLNALEAGLRRWIAWEKGCYIGQEVVARLDTYDKVRRRPAVVSAMESPPPPQTKLFLDGTATGWILNSVARVDGAGTVGLAVVGKEVNEGAALKCESGADWKFERFAKDDA